MKERPPLALIGLMIGLAAGTLSTIPAMILAVASDGLGHGNYLLARLLYPYAMLIWQSSGGEFSRPLVVLSLAQFPLYGAVMGAAWPWRRRRRLAACAMMVIHLLAAVACFGELPASPS